MVNYFPWWTKPCDTCSNSLLMPDCSLFCSLTMKTAKGECGEYSFGTPKLYKPERYKPKIKETTPKVVQPKQKMIISVKKTTPQRRLF